MVEAQPQATERTAKIPAADAAGERRCLVGGETLPKDRMIRFVVGPGDVVVPDLAEDLPGRGLWVRADRDSITAAAQKSLFAKAAKAPAKAMPELATQVIDLLRARCLSFIGLAKAAGAAVLGEEMVRDGLRGRKLSFLLLADDAKADLDTADMPVSRLFTRDELGNALGYAHIVYAGFKPHGITRRLQGEIRRLTDLLTPSNPI